MDFIVHKDVIVEDYSFQVNKEYIRYFIQNTTLSGIRLLLTVLTETVRNQLASMRALES